MIQAVLSNGQNPEYGVAAVPFPIPREEYDHVMERLVPLEIGDSIARDCRVDEIRVQEMAEKPVVGKVSFASGEKITYTDPEEYLKAIREELPYRDTSGFRYETITGDPQVRKAVDDELYNLFGEKNPRALEEYETPPKQGMNFGGM